MAGVIHELLCDNCKTSLEVEISSSKNLPSCPKCKGKMRKNYKTFVIIPSHMKATSEDRESFEFARSAINRKHRRRVF
jgi:NAD-dependent SIR2 family protein deacetylase